MPIVRGVVGALAAFFLVLSGIAAGGALPPEDREAQPPPDPLKPRIEERAFKRLLLELKETGKRMDDRVEVIGLFAYFRDVRAVPHLVAIVQSKQESMAVKTAALWALGEIGHPLAMPAFQFALMKIYDGKEPEWAQARGITFATEGEEKTVSLREMCEARLGRLAETVLLKQRADERPGFVDLLLEPLVKGGTPDKPPDEGDKREFDWGRLRAALISVAAVGDRSPTAVNALAAVLTAEDNVYPWDFKVIATETLGTILVRRYNELKDLKAKDEISDKIAAALIRAFGVTDIPEVREIGGRALRSAGWADRAARALVKVLEAFPGGKPGEPPDPTRHIRYRVIEALAYLKSKEAAEHLVLLMFDPDRNIRWRAAVALGTCGDERAAKLLRTLAKDADPFVRVKAVAALGHLQAFVALPDLVVAMDDADSRVRRQAVLALGRFGLRQAIPVLVDRGLKDKSPSVRAMAMIALGHIGLAEGLKAVPPMLADKDASVRRVAVQVLDKFLNPGATRALVSALADADEAVRADAARAVAGRIQSSPRDTLRLVTEAVAKSKGAGRVAAIQCLAADYQKLRSAQDAKRTRLYEGLLDSPKAPLAAALIAGLGDEDPKARAAAGKLLNKHGWDYKKRSLVEPVAALLKDLDPEARQVGIVAKNYLYMLK